MILVLVESVGMDVLRTRIQKLERAAAHVVHVLARMCSLKRTHRPPQLPPEICEQLAGAIPSSLGLHLFGMRSSVTVVLRDPP